MGYRDGDVTNVFLSADYCVFRVVGYVPPDAEVERGLAKRGLEIKKIFELGGGEIELHIGKK